MTTAATPTSAKPCPNHSPNSRSPGNCPPSASSSETHDPTSKANSASTSRSERRRSPHRIFGRGSSPLPERVRTSASSTNHATYHRHTALTSGYVISARFSADTTATPYQVDPPKKGGGLVADRPAAVGGSQDVAVSTSTAERSQVCATVRPRKSSSGTAPSRSASGAVMSP